MSTVINKQVYYCFGVAMKASMKALKNKNVDTKPENKPDKDFVRTENVRRRMVNIFTIFSIISTLLIGSIVGLSISRSIKNQMIESYAKGIGTQLRGTINQKLKAEDLNTPFRKEKYASFNKFISDVIVDTNVVNIKLWSTDKTVIYSNNQKLIGKKFKNKFVDDALIGNPTYEISDLRADDNYLERSQFNNLVEMYFPIYFDKDSSNVSGVYEVYMSVLPLEGYANSVMRSLAIGLGVLLFLLIVISEIASHMLKKQNINLRQLGKKLEMAADTDGLTGLYNHRHFQNYLEKETARARRYKLRFSLIMIDLDFFKNVNDRFGHQMGDSVLRNISIIFEEVLRDVDYAARYGGEEFVVILPETDANGATVAAERLRQAAENLVMETGGCKTKDPRVTISCGVADYPNCADNRESLIAAADSALLFAKRKGRNRVCYFRDITGVDIKKDDLEGLVSRLQHATMPTIEALVTAVNSRDDYATGHSTNMSSLITNFAETLGLEENLFDILKLATQVHDVGKITVPKRVLSKTESLSENEMEVIRTHPEASSRIVESASRIETLISAVLHHHENWDGSGYPKGIKGEEIPFLARMLRIADAYEAMMTDRPYRRALSKKAAFAELRKNAGTQFDPELVEKFIESLTVKKVTSIHNGKNGQGETSVKSTLT